MSKPANPKLIGAFVLGAIALIIAGLIVLGGGKFFQRTTPVVMFFQGSVAGLSVGSPVNFRGVRVGQVTNVFIRYQPNGGDPLIIPVFAELSPENVQIAARRDQKKEFRPGSGAVLRALIDDGLRAQLAIPSLVTGQATVSLDLVPGNPAEFLDTYPDRVEIPTVPSALQEVQMTVQQLYNKLSKLPLEELVEDTRTLIKGANRLVNDPAISQAVVNASQAMADLQQVARTLDSRIGPLISNLETASGTANRTLLSAQELITSTEARSQQTFREIDAMLQAGRQALTQAERTLKTTNNVIQPGAQFNYELINALNETATAARSLRDLADQLQRSPNSLLFGRPNAATGR
jgi:phospholipid/cholesterol/gamma-HCH transport system substrate-binding protein